MAKRKTAGIPSGWMTVTGNSRVKKIRVKPTGVDVIVVDGSRSNPRKRKATKKRRATKKAVNRKRPASRNVAAGYMDEDGVFHPIRKSWDYSYTRAGETGSDWHKGKGPVKSKAKRALKSKKRNPKSKLKPGSKAWVAKMARARKAANRKRR